MTVLVSIRMPSELHEELADIAKESGRSKSYLIREAVGLYLEEYADYRIALDRLYDKNDRSITSREVWRGLGEDD